MKREIQPFRGPFPTPRGPLRDDRPPRRYCDLGRPVRTVRYACGHESDLGYLLLGEAREAELLLSRARLVLCGTCALKGEAAREYLRALGGEAA